MERLEVDVVFCLIISFLINQKFLQVVEKVNFDP